MSKFELRDDEKLQMDGFMTYMKSGFNAIQGRAYLTSQRFVFCKKSGWWLFILGPIAFALDYFVKCKNVVFEIPINEIKSVYEDKYIFITLSSGAVYKMTSVQGQKWVKAIYDTSKLGLNDKDDTNKLPLDQPNPVTSSNKVILSKDTVSSDQPTPPQIIEKSSPVNNKSKNVAGWLALILGGIGIHKFYLGAWGWGIIYILLAWTWIPSIVALIEGIRYFTLSKDEFNDKVATLDKPFSFLW